MALTPRQELTLEHLNYERTLSKEEVISFCLKKLQQPSKRQRVRRHHSSSGTRKHSKAYYQNIIDHFNEE